MERGLVEHFPGTIRFNIIEEENPIDVLLEGLSQAAIQLWSGIASLQRVCRRDRPVGVLPSSITARPKGRGIMPRHEWWIDG